MTIHETLNLYVKPGDSIKNTLDVIDKGARGIALAVDEDGRLLGTVTDGDIRRAILRGISLEEKVSAIMNENYTFVSQNYSRLLVENIFTRKSIAQIPVLDDNMRVMDIIFYHDFYQKKSRENYVVIMAGGLGTRLAPLTREMPKPMLKVGARPILETIIEQLKSYGFLNIILSVNYRADIIEDYFQDGSNFGVSITYIKENKRLGTAGALKLAKDMLRESFFVVNGDILTKVNFEQFMQFHKQHQNNITIGTRKYELQVPYGVVNIEDQRVTRLEEKPLLNYFISGGMYCLEPKVLDFIPDDQYYDITQLINETMESRMKVGSFPITEYWMDIGQMEDYNRANLEYDNLFGSEISATKE